PDMGRSRNRLLSQHSNDAFHAFGAQALGEARQDRDLLLDLCLAHERAAALDAVEVSLLGQVHQGLADRSEAYPESLAKLSLAGDLRAGREPAVLDLGQQDVPDLDVQRDGRGPVDGEHLARSEVVRCGSARAVHWQTITL